MKNWRLHALRAVATILIVGIFVLTIALGVHGVGATPLVVAWIVYFFLVLPPRVRREFLDRV